MELCSLNSLKISSIRRSGLIEKPFLRGGIINISPPLPCITNNKRFAEAKKLKVLENRAQASVGSKASGIKASKDADSKDKNLVFVAGATGKVGSRTVRELLKLGFRVQAGVRSRQRAESLLQSVQQMKLDDSAKPIENLEIVECDLEKTDRIVPALANASVVICCIGASEKEVFDITGPYRIDYLATKNLIDAATFAKVDHFILLTSLGTNKVGFPAAILNLFWGVLIWKRKAEEALLASGLPYTIVRPGGMERPTDSYKETHNITLSEEDTLFGGQVSNLQVAELLACMAKNRGLSYCKVVEVIAETTAPLTPMEDLLAKIPSQRVEESGGTDGPEPEVRSSERPESSSPSAVEEPSPTKPTSERPLSPYTAYEDLKPPTTPSPTPKSSTGGSKGSNIAIEINSSAASSTVIEREAPKEEKKTNSLSPYPNYDDLKPPVSPTPNPPSGREDTSILQAASTSAAADSETSEITNTEADPSEFKLQITQPLSPYTAYEDLKPPSSPSPTPSGPKEASNGASISLDTGDDIAKAGTTSPVEKDPPPSSASPLSPYILYEDLKPPSSPSPTPSGPKEASNGASISLDTGDNDIVKAGTTSPVEKDPPPSSASPLSPYFVYEDLKPPSSPSPNAPVLSGNGKSEPPLADNSTIIQQDLTIKQQPLSPFTMYEDLKPPSSPQPSLEKL